MPVLVLVILIFVASMAVGALLGTIPCSIASKKGYNVWVWWFYGAMLFLVALIHALCLPDKHKQQAKKTAAQEIRKATILQQKVATADGVLKYKKLLDDGIITQEEFDAKKKELLGL